MPRERLSTLQFQDQYGGISFPANKLKNSELDWQRERQKTHLSNKSGLLSGVQIALRSLEKSGYMSKQDRKYMHFNALTQALEATTHGLVHITTQEWDQQNKELQGFGRSTVNILRQGIENIAKKDKGGELDFGFEKHRRAIELQTARQLNRDIASGMLDDKVAISISPYPDIADREAAADIGYFTDQKGAMLRIHEYDRDTATMTTTQIMVESSDTELLSILLAAISPEGADKKTANELLRQLAYLPKADSTEIVDIAYLYDNLLEQKTGEEHFFGRKKDDTHKDYSSVQEKTNKVLSDTDPIISHIVDIEIELANSLYLRKATTKTIQVMQQALTHKTKDGLVLPEYQREVLKQSTVGGFTEEAAEILARYQTIEAYKLMMVVAEPKRARQVIQDQQVYSTRKRYLKDPSKYFTSPSNLELHQELLLNFCGGNILTNDQNGLTSGVYTSTIGQINNGIKNINSVENGKRIFCCKCPECKKEVEAEIYGGQIHCPECGASKEWND